MLIGAHEDGIDNSGSAFLYNTAGSLLATLKCPLPGAGARFGDAVSGMGEDRVLASASSASRDGEILTLGRCSAAFVLRERAGAGCSIELFRV